MAAARRRRRREPARSRVVMSGDGLIGQVGGVLAGTGAALGVMPAGRGNDFARVVGIPDDMEGAAAVLATGRPRQIDVGEVNGKRFLCIASCGFDSDANRIANEARLVRGHLVYVYAALRALAAWKPATFTLTLDGERKRVTGYSVAAANGKAYGGGMFAAPEAELDDGLLDVGATGRRQQAPLPPRPGADIQGRAPRDARGSGVAGGRKCGSRPTARSPSTPTATTSPTYPRRCGSCPPPCA